MSRPSNRSYLLPGLALVALTQSAFADSGGGRLRNDDLLLARVANRIAIANASRCPNQMPATGLILVAIDQFPPELRAQARTGLGFANEIGIEAVVPGFSADRAGLRAGDGLLAVGDQVLAFTPLSPIASSALRDRVLHRIGALPPRTPIDLQVVRSGRSFKATLEPAAACRTFPDVVDTDNLIARSDGETIQLSSGFVERFGEDGVAVAFAHELAHLVLQHGTKASKRNEREADRLSVHLLASAGYDPSIAPRFWREHGASLGTRGHDSVNKRIALLEAEIAAMETAS